VLKLIQEHLEAIYRITSAPDIRSFLVSDDEVGQVLGRDRRRAEEWVLVREVEDGVDIGVYIDATHLEDLAAAATPVRALDESFRAFCVATEGVSHFLLLVDRARRAEPVTMLELEAQAEVDKYVSARLHCPTRAREWRARLFKDASLAPDLSTEERERYREAGRMAAGFCETLDDLPTVEALLAEVRAFWREPAAKRLAVMRRLAA
jgi:hypothetical protein